MTARVNMLYVVLEKDIRIDDVQPIRDAIGQIKGVLKVDENIVTPVDHVASMRIRAELGKKLFDVIYPEAKNVL